MNRPDPRERRTLSAPKAKQERLIRTIVVGCTLVGVAGIAVVASARGDDSPSEAAAVSGFQSVDPGAVVAVSVESPASSTEAPIPVADPVTPAADAVVADTTVAADAAATGDSTATEDAIADEGAVLTEDCTVAPKSLAYNATGVDVQCLQQALVREGFYSGPVSGTYDYATAQAVETYQTEHNLFVDGVAGRETGRKLGIWPEEKLNVVRTPPPAPGAMDSTGYLLSPVASTGDNAPPLPANSGSGYRVVYERISQRVWAVDENERIVRSWLVSGSQYNNEMPGTHQVYSRSEQSTAWNGRAILPYMIRWLKTDIGAIGFHGIPRHVEDNSPYQTDAELGTRLSGGCQRQNDLDAKFLWNFAPVGTKVVVL